MDRQEHLQWCKKRAMEYVNEGNLLEGVTSMMSDLSKHKETKCILNGPLGMLGLLALQQAQCGDVDGVKRFVLGFN